MPVRPLAIWFMVIPLSCGGVRVRGSVCLWDCCACVLFPLSPWKVSSKNWKVQHGLTDASQCYPDAAGSWRTSWSWAWLYSVKILERAEKPGKHIGSRGAAIERRRHRGDPENPRRGRSNPAAAFELVPQRLSHHPANPRPRRRPSTSANEEEWTGRRPIHACDESA